MVLYKTIFSGYVSTAVPAVGAFVPVFTLLTGIVFAGQGLPITFEFIAALVLLIAGSSLLSSQSKKGFTFSPRILLLILGAAFFLGVSFGLTKIIYDAAGFVTGFVWMRWGGGFASLALLFSKKTRNVIFKDNPIKEKEVYSPVIWGKIAGGAGFFFQQFAINTATLIQVPIITALVGVQYFFILFLAWIVSLKNPKILKEELSKHSILPRFIGTILIAVGMWLFFV